MQQAGLLVRWPSVPLAPSTIVVEPSTHSDISCVNNMHIGVKVTSANISVFPYYVLSIRKARNQAIVECVSAPHVLKVISIGNPRISLMKKLRKQKEISLINNPPGCQIVNLLPLLIVHLKKRETVVLILLIKQMIGEILIDTLLLHETWNQEAPLLLHTTLHD
jgi:hypothetical protein